MSHLSHFRCFVIRVTTYTHTDWLIDPSTSTPELTHRSYLAYPAEEDGVVILHDALSLKIANKVLNNIRWV